jgi:hypothetical protein
MDCDSRTKEKGCVDGKSAAYTKFGLVIVFSEIIIAMIMAWRYQCLALAQ